MESNKNYTRLVSRIFSAVAIVMALLVAVPDSFADIKIDKKVVNKPAKTKPSAAAGGKRGYHNRQAPAKSAGIRNQGGQGIQGKTDVPKNQVINRNELDKQSEKQYDQAMDLYENGDNFAAFNLMKQAADNGYADAQAMVGYFYRNGIGCSENYRSAVTYYRQAANRGNLMATNNLGFCYQHGYGVEEDGNKAMYYYTQAAEKGYSVAQSNLGLCFLNAIGINAPNKVQAGRWFRKAALQGDETAQSNVNDLEEEALPVLLKAIDYLKSGSYNLCYGYLNEASNLGSDLAQALLGDMTINGIGTNADLTEGLKWLELAADQENAAALKYFPKYNNRTMARIAQSAYKSHFIELLQLSSEDGDESADKVLAALGERSGSSSSSSTYSAQASSGRRAKSLSAYSNADNSELLSDGLNYILGEDGFEKDAEFGFKLAKRAADNGDEMAQHVLGLCYYLGEGTEVNNYAAFNCFSKSAATGYAAGQYMLGVCYENGYGTAVDMTKARHYYNLAAAQDYEDAIEALNRLNGNSGKNSGNSMMDAIDDI